MSLINQSESNKKSKFAEGVKKLIKGIEKSTKVDVSGDMNKSDEAALESEVSDLKNQLFDAQQTIDNNLSSFEALTSGNFGPEYTIPEGITTIGSLAFNYNYWYELQDGIGLLQVLKLPNSVTEIKRHAFAYQSNLARVDIGSDASSRINTIDGNAFPNHHVEINIKSHDVPTLTDIGSLIYCAIYVPDKSEYEMATQWSALYENNIFSSLQS